MMSRLQFLPPLAAAVAMVTAGTAAAHMPAVRAGSPIDGRWHASMTRSGLLQTGEVSPALAAQLYGPWTAKFANGRFVATNGRTGRGAKGTFVVTGKLVRFVFASGIGIKPGDVDFCNASVYRERLTFVRVPGRPCRWDVPAVWTRVS
jgi:hypothetical protein